MDTINFLNSCFWENSAYFVLLVLSMIYILFQNQQEENGKRMVWYTICAFVFVLWNPLFHAVAVLFFSDDLRAYLRIYYLIPLMTLLAYAGTLFYTNHVSKQEKATKKIAFIIILSISILFGGRLYSSTMYQTVDNIYKIDAEALDISDRILADSDAEKIAAVVPWIEELYFGIRQYTSRIMMVGQTDFIPDMSSLELLEEEVGVDYYITAKNNIVIEGIANNGYKLFWETKQYLVYKKVEI